jgi:hypothetical protein
VREMKKKEYERLMDPLRLELNNVARWLQETGHRMVVLIEGRDTAGKGGCVGAIADDLNPRQVRIAALPKPSEREQTQWYFQRYVEHLPAAGELVLFDRSWYNRAGVERVMGYCTKEQYGRFLNTRRSSSASSLTTASCSTSIGCRSIRSGRRNVWRNARPILSSGGSCRRSTSSLASTTPTMAGPGMRCSRPRIRSTRRGMSSTSTTSAAGA